MRLLWIRVITSRILSVGDATTARFGTCFGKEFITLRKREFKIQQLRYLSSAKTLKELLEGLAELRVGLVANESTNISH